MSRRWFRRWHRPRVKQNHKMFKAEVLRVVTVSLRVDAALRHNSEQHAYRLPEELLFMICQYLTTAEAVTLMISCARFWHSRTGNGGFARIWQRMTSIGVHGELSRMATRFYVMRMLEYDGLLQRRFPSRYCCWGCMKTHDRQAFSSEEFAKKIDLKSKQDSYPEEAICRSCVSVKRYVWFGTCREMSFGELRHIFANAHMRTQHIVNNWIKLPDSNPTGFIFLDYSTLANKNKCLKYNFHIARTSDVAIYNSIKQHARTVNLPLCPHLRVSHPAVYRLYRQPTMAHYCMFCTTAVQIVHSHVISVYVFRYVGSLLSPTDPVWMAQSYRVRCQELEAYCHAFCDWYGNLYGENGHVANGGGFMKFESTHSEYKPFKGVFFSSPKWPEGTIRG